MLTLSDRYTHNGNAVAWGRLGSGPPLVLVHGTPFSSQVWRKIAPLLAERWTVYFFDLIGYGQSEQREGQDVSLAVQNGLLAALFNHWGLERPELLCHDFGGATVLRAYYLNNLRYKRMTIFDPVAVAPWGSPFVAHVRQYEAAFAGLPGYAHEALLRSYLQSAAHRQLTEDALQTYMAPWLGDAGQPAFYRQIAQMDQKYTDEIESRYATLDCPVTLLWGEKDEWIPLDRGEKLASLLTGGKIKVIPDAGHLVQEDAPEAIVAAMFQREC
ncbi:alpha/beta fold hydrolase [Roseibium sp.]|uniref:alpha/beta fold hydrolase n=1 Tax=Roseibium sp. TaxID=1936156 RepID=UPI003B516AB5